MPGVKTKFPLAVPLIRNLLCPGWTQGKFSARESLRCLAKTCLKHAFKIAVWSALCPCIKEKAWSLMSGFDGNRLP
jgi:hypothetical protein